MRIQSRTLIDVAGVERQITHTPHSHVLTNVNVFSADSQWIVYDVRTRGGEVFDGDRIEQVNVRSGEIRVVYQSTNGAGCGVATFDPTRDRVVFIQGPENPTADFSYGAARRHGLIVDIETGKSEVLDARDLASPYTTGALRGGTHVHVFSPDGRMVSSTYEDHVLDSLVLSADQTHDLNQRSIAVSQLDHPVAVSGGHNRNQNGCAFSLVVADTTNHPAPGSDQISRACEEGWIGTNGYVRFDGTRQNRAIAFQGSVVFPDGRSGCEVFVADLPDDLTTVPLPKEVAGSDRRRARPPAGVVQRRLTFTSGRAFPGIQGPRHWLRSPPDGSQIAFLMRDTKGVAQLWTITPNGGEPRQVTHLASSIESSLTWNPDGRFIAHVADGSICATDVAAGQTYRLTRRCPEFRPRPQACVFSPDGKSVAFVRPVLSGAEVFDQIHSVEWNLNKS